VFVAVFVDVIVDGNVVVNVDGDGDVNRRL
jgi:hypothetical protein